MVTITLPSGVGNVLEYVGGEVSWEFLKCEDMWYVTASHTSDKYEDTFKCQESDESLLAAVERVAMQIFVDGPAWVGP